MIQTLVPPRDGHSCEIEGIPDLAGTRWLCFGTAAICAVFSIWLPMAAMPKAEQTDAPGLVVFLILAAAAFAGSLTIWLVRAGFSPGAWVRVTSRGVDLGSGSRDASALEQILWTHIVPNPERTHDIGVTSDVYRVAPNPYLTFWYQHEDGSLAQRSLPLSLRYDALRCLRFRNAHDVRVAMLRHLAMHPDLRFAADVFVSAGVDPENWTRMPGPRRAPWLAAVATVAFILGFAALTIGDWSPGMLATGTLLIFGAGLFLYARYWPRAYSRLTGIITFRPPS